MEINHPPTHAEIANLYPIYETALTTNDVPTLQALFWHSPHTIRYGATENLHGIDEIEAFRLARPAANLARTVTRLDIATYGPDHATVNLEFSRETNGSLRHGRQSQTWVRLAPNPQSDPYRGWRIVSAHVSLLS